MTLEEFLKKLKKCKDLKWHMTSDGSIRSEVEVKENEDILYYECCPITGVAYCTDPSDYPPDMEEAAGVVGPELGLDELISTEIVAAADAIPNCSSQIRDKLLKACGLKEKAKT